MRRRRHDACAYCGSRRLITSDHIPPKIMFPKPRSADLITVPACARCNSGFQKDDEYFCFSVVTPAAVRDPVAYRLWYDTVGPFLDRSPKLKPRILAAYSMKEHIAPDGRSIMAKSVELEAERVRRIAERIVAGLLWHHGHAVPDRSTLRFAVEMGPRVDGQPAAKEAADKVIGDAPLFEVGGGVFRYKYGILTGDPALSNWLLEFYGAMHFFVSVLRKS